MQYTYLISPKEKRQIKQNKIKIDRQLDLHNLTVNNAYDKLINFLEQCYDSSIRLILIISGKGKPMTSYEEYGILRTSVNDWLQRDPTVNKYVSRYGSANLNHGGEGAFYVFLRKNRKDIF